MKNDLKKKEQQQQEQQQQQQHTHTQRNHIFYYFTGSFYPLILKRAYVCESGDKC